jgi:hypothetical protein
LKSKLKMIKKNLILLLLAIFTSYFSSAQYDKNWAIGLKIGEPVGLNIRKYFSFGEKAFDVNIGSYGFIYGSTRYYNKNKNPAPIYDQAGVMLQGIYSWHKTLTRKERLHVYYGFGGQLNSRNRPLGSGNRDSFKVISVGPAGNAGIEFEIPENDLAVFLDAGGYLEVAPKPFFANPQINIGLRLNLVK